MNMKTRMARLERVWPPEPTRCECGAIPGWVPGPLFYDGTEPWLNSTCPKCGSPLNQHGRAYPSRYPGKHVKCIIIEREDRATGP